MSGPVLKTGAAVAAVKTTTVPAKDDKKAKDSESEVKVEAAAAKARIAASSRALHAGWSFMSAVESEAHQVAILATEHTVAAAARVASFDTRKGILKTDADAYAKGARAAVEAASKCDIAGHLQLGEFEKRLDGETEVIVSVEDDKACTRKEKDRIYDALAMKAVVKENILLSPYEQREAVSKLVLAGGTAAFAIEAVKAVSEHGLSYGGYLVRKAQDIRERVETANPGSLKAMCDKATDGGPMAVYASIVVSKKVMPDKEPKNPEEKVTFTKADYQDAFFRSASIM